MLGLVYWGIIELINNALSLADLAAKLDAVFVKRQLRDNGMLGVPAHQPKTKFSDLISNEENIDFGTKNWILT